MSKERIEQAHIDYEHYDDLAGLEKEKIYELSTGIYTLEQKLSQMIHEW